VTVPSSPSVGSIELGVGDIDTGGVDAGGDDTGGDDDTGGELVIVADPVGVGELLVADAEADVLVGGADCVCVGDCRPLGVGPAELRADGVFDAVSRLVPTVAPSAAVGGTEDVVGCARGRADALGDGDVDFPPLFVVTAVGVTLLLSRTAMIAMIPQAARPAPASSRPLRRGREPPKRSGSSL
jgi:hypothetical protein